MAAAPALSAAERRDRLRLCRSENVGARTYFDLLRVFGSAAGALDALPDLARRGGRRRPIAIAAADAIDAELAGYDRLGVALVAHDEPDYPPLLAATANPPPLIAVRGDAGMLARPAIAVIGSRNASAAGCRFARDIAGELGRRGFIIVSGLARGIDGNAHAAALETGTVAVVASGIDIAYPPEHQGLYERICAAGAVVAEQPLGAAPLAQFFPRRNRIISGLSLAVVVVEAARRSGSLTTARFALEQGREVCAVPGFPTDPRHQGTNALIRSGAVLTESADDVVETVQGMVRTLPAAAPEEPVPPLDEPSRDLAGGRATVAALLGPTPTTVDEIVRQCGLTAAEVLTILVELDLAGRLNRHLGNQVSLIRPED